MLNRRLARLQGRVAALEEQVAALTERADGSHLTAKVYKCRDCNLLIGAREGFERDECPSCGSEVPQRVGAMVVGIREGEGDG